MSLFFSFFGADSHQVKETNLKSLINSDSNIQKNEKRVLFAENVKFINLENFQGANAFCSSYRKRRTL